MTNGGFQDAPQDGRWNQKKSQQYTKEAQVHSILKQLITQFHFYLIDSHLSFIIYVNKTE